MAARRERRLGEILVARGVIDEEQLGVLVAEQERTGRLLGELAVAMGLAHSGDVSSALIEQIDSPTTDAQPQRDHHFVLVPTHAGYHLIQREGTAPAVGDTVHVPVDDRVGRYVVVMTTRAPLPASSLRCARLEAV